MKITRLQQATTSLEVTVQVSKKLRPYFTEWYNEKKETGESPSDFALRILKEQAYNYYVEKESLLEISKLDATRQSDLDNLADDVKLLETEI